MMDSPRARLKFVANSSIQFSLKKKFLIVAETVRRIVPESILENGVLTKPVKQFFCIYRNGDDFCLLPTSVLGWVLSEEEFDFESMNKACVLVELFQRWGLIQSERPKIDLFLPVRQDVIFKDQTGLCVMKFNTTEDMIVPFNFNEFINKVRSHK